MPIYKIEQTAGLKSGIEPKEIIERFERIETQVHESEDAGSDYVVKLIIEAINERSVEGKYFVLGLTTGRSPEGIYRKLVEAYHRDEVSFANVVVFSLDEFFPISPKEQQSRNFRIHEDFIDDIDIHPQHVFFPDGTIPLNDVADFCHGYEAQIQRYGGIDLMLLGVGEMGQIGFNEPGSYHNTRSRLVVLSNESRKNQSALFYGLENTPSRAITMGIATIMAAHRIVLIAWGEEKAAIVRQIVEGEVSPNVPASYLQQHPHISMVVDNSAASELTRISTPWLVGTCDWTPRLIRKAVIWLCGEVQKPILKLTYQNYIDHNLGQLLDTSDRYDNVNIKVFNDLQHTISGWPGGKPNADDSTRPERSFPFPKRVVIFSPHPDDDVISMGGTFSRLVDQGHDVHVAYETSGNIAVHDDVVLQMADAFRECGFGNYYPQVERLISEKKKGEPESVEMRALKGGIRRSEARAACRHFGLNPDTNVHFLNLPFYETGGIKKGVLSETDVKIVVDLLQKVQPHQIYAAGDLSDPHGTHRVCIEAVLQALEQLQDEPWIKTCSIWLYRGAWQEWSLDMVDMAVPLSPGEVLKKRHAIYRHLSQKDIVPFPGEDQREFWQRAEERTQHTAEAYNKLGMAEYQAIEVFVRLR